MATFEEHKQLLVDAKVAIDGANTAIGNVLTNSEAQNLKLDEILVFIRNLQQGGGPVTPAQWDELTGLVGEMKTAAEATKTSAETAQEKAVAVLTEIDALDDPQP